jgi:iron complex outermembrane recepter protein
VPALTIIGVSPLPGGGIDRDKVPANPVTIGGGDIAATGEPDLARALQRLAPGVAIADVAASPFQPDVAFRGFDASPVLGTPQGLAIYQNGVRINEAFGDVVNWDVVPDFAIARATLASGNPVYGLNALGGALALEMKTGFTFDGVSSQVMGGSFSRLAGLAEYGARAGNFASYVGARSLYEAGWRDHSPSTLRKLYADLGGEKGGANLHLSFAGASNAIDATGPTPVGLLPQSASATYTRPQSTANSVAFLTLSGAAEAGSSTTVGGNLYYRRFHQRVVNGNTTDAQPCGPPPAPGPATLCFNDAATVLRDTTGAPVPNVAGDGALGEIDRTGTDTDALGGALQFTATPPLLGHDNHFTFGTSIDRAATRFRTSSELGLIGPDLNVTGAGFIIDEPAGDLAPVALDTTTLAYGVYAADTFDVTSRLSLTASARFNLAALSLRDGGSGALAGDHRYSRLNPAIGATYKLAPDLVAYAGYSEANRAPTPAELACADPTRPCLIDSFLVSDPELKQVVAQSWEAGLRGTIALPDAGGIAWNAGLYRTDSNDDIVNVPTTISGFGFFRNIGTTRRQGIEAGLRYHAGAFSAHAQYALLDATFRTPLTLSAPFNPAADASGNIMVRPGDRLPSLPRHRLNIGVNYEDSRGWTLGAELTAASGQYLRGDESNQASKLPGYRIVNLDGSYALSAHFELFALVQNLFDARYDTFGTFFDTTKIPALGLTDPRTLTPGAPLAVFAGLRAHF